MMSYGKLLIRVGISQAIAKELCVGARNAGAKTFCAVAANSIPTSNEPSSTSSTSKSASSQKVDSSCCGFAKDLINAPSTVLDNSVFGEDACFIARYKSTHVAGVADGVGGWRNYGINPAEFSSNLMKNCSNIVKSGDFQPQRPDLIISKAFQKLSVSPRPVGSSTACVVVIHKKTLYAANLGDSGYLVYRNGNIIQRSTEQIHAFNTPFQLTLLPKELEMDLFIKDTPEKSDLQKLELQSGDVVLIATDGLWDNMPESQILEVLKDVEPENLQAKCNTMALIARRLSNDVRHASPFALKASEHGIRISGGKSDDITIVLLFVN